MKEISKENYHKLYGQKDLRMAYRKSDFLDYLIMLSAVAVILYFTYGASSPLTYISGFICIFMGIMFPMRHGVKLQIPLLFKRPQDLFFLLIHKLENLRLPFLLAAGLLLFENVLIYLTPHWSHQTELMQRIGLYFLYGHLAVLTLYRTVILFAHHIKRDQVKEILLDSSWKVQLKRQSNITLEIFHAYLTGLLTHIIYVAPWFLVLTFCKFSMILMPLTCIAAFFIQTQFVKEINAWFYRDHWLGHNSELEFVYLHGSHHDAIPSGLIGVAGNGFLEGWSRGLLGFPIALYNPLMALLYYTIDVKIDIDSHQYIPGVFPGSPKEIATVTQHSTHHYGRVEPYSFAIKLDQPDVPEKALKAFRLFPSELSSSINLDEMLTGFKWDNSKHRWYLNKIDQYQAADSDSEVGADEVVADDEAVS